MPRNVPSQVLRFVASIAVIVLLATRPAAAAPQPADQQKLKERVDALESQLKEAQAKADSAAIEKDYIERVEKDTEKYYERAFEMQVKFLDWIVILVAAAPLLVGLLSFRAIARRIQDRLRHASTQLRTEFAERLAKETTALQAAHAAELKTLEDGLKGRIEKEVRDLKARSAYTFAYSQGLSFAVAGDYVSARPHFRWAVKSYAKNRDCFPPIATPPALVDLFRAIKLANPQNFTDEAMKELGDDLYNGLGNELNAAAIELDWLGPLIRDRKQHPSQPTAAESKTGDAEPPEPAPAPLPKGKN